MLSVIQGIAVTAKRAGGRPALISGSRTLSYSELLDAIACVSNHFVDRGLRPRAKLFINIADPDLRLVTTLAAMHCGLIPFAILEIGDLMAQVDYDYVVGAPTLQTAEPVPDLIVDQTVLGGKLSDRTLRAFPDQADDAILLIGSTTGSTGRRKLIAETYGMSRYKALDADGTTPAADAVPRSYMEFKATDRVLSTYGDLTNFGMTIAMQCLLVGATYVRLVRDRFECLTAVNAFNVNWIRTTPGTIGELMDAMDERNIVCPSVKRVRIAGSLFDQGLVERVERHFTAQISVGYGTTEIGRISAGVVTSADFEPGRVGELQPEVKLLTAGTRARPAPLVMVHNPLTYRPYYVDGKIVPFHEKFYALPDLGFAENGRLYLTGRDDEVYNVNGTKIAFSLIAAALRAEPDVKDVAIVGAAPIGDPTGLVIGVVSGGPLDPSRLLTRVATAAKSRPAADNVRFFALDAIPHNAFGKTDRGAVIAAYRRGSGIS